MSNGRTRRNKRDHLVQWEVYDALPPLTRQALQEGPQSWCAVNVARGIKKLRRQHPAASAEMIDYIVSRMIHRWHLDEIAAARPWQPKRKSFESVPLYPVPSPHIAADATMQLSNR